MKTNKLHHFFLNSSGITTDTRTITQNSIFFALKGANFNGNRFAQEALDKGAMKVIIDEPEYHKSTGETILVSNVLLTLQQLANFHRKYLGIPIIALTGSNGKTTTKELINAVLSKRFNCVATKGNLNNHIGVPLTLLSMNNTTEIGIVEMGANHPKEIEQLSEIALPDFGYITNFGKAHLEGFGSVAGVITAKSELYDNLRKYDKKAFINSEDKLQIENSKGVEKIIFGNKESQFPIKLVSSIDTLEINFDLAHVISPLVGSYNFSNIAAAIAIGLYFKVSGDDIKNAIENYTPNNNRSQVIDKASNKIIMDAYNANPSSMIAALDNFYESTGINKIVILGDMFELGNDAGIEHQTIVDYLQNNQFGAAHLVGKNFWKCKVHSSHINLYTDYDAFEDFLNKHIPINSFILVKGSRGMALERVLDIL